LIALMTIFALVLWQGPITLLSICAMALIAIGRMQTDERRLRVFVIAGGVFWVLYDFIGEAWIALVADLGALAVGIAMLTALTIRIRIEWRPSALPAF